MLNQNVWGYTLWPVSIIFLPRETFTFFGILKTDRLRLARARTDVPWSKKIPFIVLPGGDLPYQEEPPQI